MVEENKVNKLYHFYMDEGGIFGSASVLISNKKLRLSNQEYHISLYYKGKMYKEEILLYIERFKLLYPKCKVDITESIEISFKSRKEFPREMLVSDDKVNWKRTIVRGTIKSNYGRHVSEIKTYAGKAVFCVWRYVKEID